MERTAQAIPRKRFDLLAVLSALEGGDPGPRMVRAMEDPFPVQSPPPPPTASDPPGPRRPRPENAGDADPIKRGPQSPAPPPQKWIEYVSPLVHASRTAYMEAPADVREGLDRLAAVSDFWKITLNVWSGTVGTWTREGLPSDRGNAVLRRFPALVPWVLSLKAKTWQPWEERQYLSSEDLAILGTRIPDPVEGLPEIFLRPRR